MKFVLNLIIEALGKFQLSQINKQQKALKNKVAKTEWFMGISPYFLQRSQMQDEINKLEKKYVELEIKKSKLVVG